MIQQLICLAVVALAGVYLVRRGWQVATRSDSSSCGGGHGCHGCQGGPAGERPLVELQLPMHDGR